MLAMSLAVVRKMLDAVAGSAPKRFSVSGITAPAKPAIVQLPTIATSTMKPSIGSGCASPLHRRVDEHAKAGGDADQQAVEEAEQAFLRHQPADELGLELAERDAAKRDRQRLAAGIAGLAGHDRQEDGEDDELVDGAFEDADHGGRDKRGEQVDLQPGMAKAEAARQGRREPLLLVDADHLARLGADLDRLFGEQLLAADQPDQAALAVADRIDREMLGRPRS